MVGGAREVRSREKELKGYKSALLRHWYLKKKATPWENGLLAKTLSKNSH